MKDNFMLVSLLVGLLGVIVGVLSLVAEIKKRKNKHEEQPIYMDLIGLLARMI